MTSPGHEHWYIYYTLAPRDRTAALARVQAMQEALAAATGVRARVEECVARDYPDRLTWMEVYEGVADPAAFGRALAAALTQSGIDSAIDGARQVERFKVL